MSAQRRVLLCTHTGRPEAVATAREMLSRLMDAGLRVSVLAVEAADCVDDLDGAHGADMQRPQLFAGCCFPVCCLCSVPARLEAQLDVCQLELQRTRRLASSRGGADTCAGRGREQA